MSKTLRFTLILFFLLLLGRDMAAAQGSVPLPDATLTEFPAFSVGSQPLSPLDDPGTVVAEANGSFVYGGGFLYWENDCVGSVDTLPVYIRRRAETGTVVQTLYEVITPTHTQCASVSKYNTADDSGFFCMNYDQSRLEARLTAAPETAINIASLTDLSPILVTDENYVYYNQSGGIYRTNKDSFGGTRISDATDVTGLAVDDTYIYWLDDTGLYRSDKTCTNSSCWNDKEQLSAWGGEHLTWKDEDELIWSSHSGGYWRIYHKRLGVSGVFSIYNAPDTSTYNIGRPVYHDGCYFWLEDTVYDLINPPNNLLRRKCSSSTETIAEGLTARDYLAAGAFGVLFADANGIYYMPYDAAAIVKDFYLDGMEVTQGIQSLYNDVSLVAEKTTYVRVFGLVTADRPADAVQVVLHGSRNGSELPGSPLHSVNGPQSLNQGIPWDRGNADDGWLFKLPRSWTQAGDLHLEAEIDPRGVYDDPNRGNNTLAGDFVFHYKPPLCIVFMPVRTHAGQGSTDNPHFGSLLDLSTRLLPVPYIHNFIQSTPVEELEVCLKWGFIPYPCYGPYELWEEGAWYEAWRDDESAVIDSIATRWAFSDDPDVCDDAGANTHYVGMVHPNSKTMNGTVGLGRYSSYASWVKFPPYNTTPPVDYPWTWPDAGNVLPHELGHNYDRYHVNCNGPDNIDGGYPYYDQNGESCKLDDGELTAFSTHFGFDINSLTPIKPDVAADLMSYGSRIWISDYTWEALFSRVDEPTMLMADSRSRPASPERVDLASSDSVVVVSGIITPSASQGRLNHAWVYPTNGVSNRVLQKWQTIAAPSVRIAAAPPPTQYLLRLLDANGVTLDDRAFAPELIFDGSSEDKKSGFMLSFPAPDVPVAQIDLLIYSSVVDSLHPGENTPSVQILQPAGGETFDDQMTIVWQATDSDIDDRLLYNVQYSPDQGQTWHALVTNWPGLPDADTVTLTLDSLMGVPASTTGGLVRVAASDGYNTGIATSSSFVVSNRPPQPYIVSPAPDQLFEAGQIVMLRGGAGDAEDGSLSGEALSWDVTGQSTITDSEAALAGLAPGDYKVTLTAEDSDGLTATAQTTLTVSPLYVPDLLWSIDDPELDGLCDDEAYASGPLLPLEPYPDGNQGAVHLIRTDDYLWACFSGLNHGITPTAPFMNSAGLVIDANHSGEHQVQSDDYWFYVQEDGTPATKSGTNWGYAGPGGLLTRISANDNAWNAELRIDASVIGGWDHAAGLELVHVWVPESGSGHYSWPYDAVTQYPDTWATTILGEWPRIENLTPSEATEDDSGALVGVEGENFESGAVALWNGKTMTTSVIGSTYLLFTVDAADLKKDGIVEVRVQNPGLEDYPSNALTFVIKNQVPTVTSLTPHEATAGDSGAVIGVSGQNFDNGAVALWNGEPMTTTVIGSTFLMFTADASDLATVRHVAVSVLNPEPSDGPSDIITFTILAPPNQSPDAPSNPTPADGTSDAPTSQQLSWQGSDPDGQPLHYDLAFGATNPPPLVASNLTITSYNPGRLVTDTTYYWIITATDGLSSTVGPLWSFDTALEASPNRAPDIPYNPNPADKTTGVSTDHVLSWRSGDADNDPLTYDIYFGTSYPPLVVSKRLTTPIYDPGTLAENTKYYWSVNVSDGISTTVGPIWRFETVTRHYIYLPFVLRNR